MKQDEIIEMAIKAEFVSHGKPSDEDSELFVCTDEDILRFAKLVAERALADPMREVQKLGQEIEQQPPQRTWIGLEGAEFGWFCHTDFLNARKYTKEQRKKICNQLLSEAQSWDIGEYQLMMHDSTKLKENT
jgi:hypothetical protein